jgi:hypothetical protein
MTIKNKQELLNYICDIVEKRVYDGANVRAEVAYDMISQAIDEYTDNMTRLRGQESNDVIYDDYSPIGINIKEEVGKGFAHIGGIKGIK